MTELDRCHLTVIPENDWHPDSDNTICELCKKTFTFTRRRHHCRFCGKVVCDTCSKNRCNSHRICDKCFSKYNGERSGRRGQQAHLSADAITALPLHEYNEYNIGDCIILESVRNNPHNFLLVGIVEEGNNIYYIVTEKGVGESFILYNKDTNEISFTLGIAEDGEKPPTNFPMDRSYEKIMRKGPPGNFDSLLKTSILFDSRTNECIMGGKRFRKYDSITFYAEDSLAKTNKNDYTLSDTLYESFKYNVTAYVEDIIPSNFSTNSPTEVVLKVTSGNIVRFLSHNQGTYNLGIMPNSIILLHNSKVEGNTMVDYGNIVLEGSVDFKSDNIREIRVDDVVKIPESQAGGNKHRKNKNKKSKRVIKRYISKRYKNRRNKVTKRSKRSKKMRRR